MTARPLKFIRKQYNHERFEEADLRESEFTKATFNGCHFRQLDLRGSQFRSTVFNDCTFEKVRFTHSFFSKTSLDEFAVKCSNCLISKCDFNQISTDLSHFHELRFEHCKFKGTDFSGAQLSNVKFIGKVEGCSFLPTAEVLKNGLLAGFFLRTKSLTTSYKNVDFTAAQLIGITLNGFDKAEVKLPIGPEYLYLDNARPILNEVRTALKNSDSNLVALFDGLYALPPNARNAFFDSNDFKEDWEFQVFETIKKTQAQRSS